MGHLPVCFNCSCRFLVQNVTHVPPYLLAGMYAVLQYDNRPLSEEYLILQKSNRDYCERHGYDYLFYQRTFDIPPYWVKVLLVRHILLTGRYKGVLWLDTDAVIHNSSLSLYGLTRLKSDRFHFYYSADNPRWSSPFNAGVFLVRNTRIGRHIMDTWLNAYNPLLWTNDVDLGWYTEGDWAGPNYEQGAFVEQVMPVYQQYMCCLPAEVLQGTEISPSAFTLHFAAKLKQFIPDYLKTLYPRAARFIGTATRPTGGALAVHVAYR